MHVSSLHYHYMNLFHLDHSLLDDPLPKLNALCEAVDSILQRRCFVSMIFKIPFLYFFPLVFQGLMLEIFQRMALMMLREWMLQLRMLLTSYQLSLLIVCFHKDKKNYLLVYFYLWLMSYIICSYYYFWSQIRSLQEVCISSRRPTKYHEF